MPEVKRRPARYRNKGQRFLERYPIGVHIEAGHVYQRGALFRDVDEASLDHDAPSRAVDGTAYHE